MLNIVKKILFRCENEYQHLPSTELFNEGWMLRLILYWFEQEDNENHQLSFHKDARWCSEALLPTQFSARYRGDELAENWTHADGIIGHFTLGNEEKKRDLLLTECADQFLVLEAKMFSLLSSGVSNAPYYNQAARETVSRSSLELKNLNELGFYVLAPQEQLESEPSFEQYMKKENIKLTVKKRVDAYDEEEGKRKQIWFENYFLSLLEKTEIKCLTWEEILSFIQNHDINYYEQLEAFYNKCIKYN